MLFYPAVIIPFFEVSDKEITNIQKRFFNKTIMPPERIKYAGNGKNGNDKEERKNE